MSGELRFESRLSPFPSRHRLMSGSPHNTERSPLLPTLDQLIRLLLSEVVDFLDFAGVLFLPSCDDIVEVLVGEICPALPSLTLQYMPVAADIMRVAAGLFSVYELIRMHFRPPPCSHDMFVRVDLEQLNNAPRHKTQPYPFNSIASRWFPCCADAVCYRPFGAAAARQLEM